MEMFSGNEQLTTKNEDDVEQTEIKVSNDKIRWWKNEDNNNEETKNPKVSPDATAKQEFL